MCLLRLGASRERLSIYQDSTSVGRYLGVVDTGSSTTCRILPGGQVAKEQQASRSQSHATNIPTHQPTPLSHPRSQAASTPNECRADDCARARAHTRRTTPPTPKSIIIILIIGVFGSPCLDPGDTTNVAMERHKDARQTRSGIGFPIPRASRKRVRLPPGVAHTHTHIHTPADVLHNTPGSPITFRIQHKRRKGIPSSPKEEARMRMPPGAKHNAKGPQKK